MRWILTFVIGLIVGFMLVVYSEDVVIINRTNWKIPTVKYKDINYKLVPLEIKP